MSRSRTKCSIDGCDSHRSSPFGYCSKHAYRFRRHGDPLGGRTPPGDPLKFINEVAVNYAGDECLIWPYARNSAGYGHLHLDGRHQLVSRIVCEKVHGWANMPWDAAAHSCGNGHLACCAPKHLRWASDQENAADMIAHGRSQRGERMHMSKLTDESVRHIRSSSASNADLAELYGVTPSNIGFVRRGKTWRHVQ